LFGLLLKTGLLLLLRAASVCCSCFSSVSKPVFLYSLPAGPAGVHGRGSARALPRVGPRQAPAQQWGAAVAVPAVFGYNVFAARLNRFDGEIEGFGAELIALLARERRI
jgi:hypothetical protein